MRVTIPHYFDFGADRSVIGDGLLGRADAWDALRTKTSGPFALPATRKSWEVHADAQRETQARARDLHAILERLSAERAASYAVGGATLELWLHRLRPNRRLLLTDFAPVTVERLHVLFPEAEARVHDLLRDPPLEADVHIFHRIEPEFTKRQWRDVFRRFSDREVILIASSVLDLRLAKYHLHMLLRRGTIRAGVIRNRSALDALWRPTHRSRHMRFHDLEGWHLVPIDRD